MERQTFCVEVNMALFSLPHFYYKYIRREKYIYYLLNSEDNIDPKCQ